MSNGVFFIIWGLFFGGGPLLTIMITFIQNKQFDIFPLLFILIFVVIGAFAFMHGIKTIIKEKNLHRLQKHGTKTKATFVSMNEVEKERYTITLSYLDQDGNNITITTKNSYTFKQASAYKAIKKFDILYEKNNVLIIQTYDIDDILREKQDSNNFDNEAQESLKKKLQAKHYYICEYCGSIQIEPGKCNSCGANVTKEKTRLYKQN